MKKCVRCGVEVADDMQICEECGFDFTEYEKILKYNTIKVKEDPIDLSKEEKTYRIERPILAVICGMIGLLCSLLIIATNAILMMMMGFLFSILAIMFGSKESLVKLIPLKNIGKWFGYIGFVLSLFFSVYVIIGLFF